MIKNCKKLSTFADILFKQGPYIAVPEDLVPLGWTTDPDCLLIDLHFVRSQFDISWRIEKELGAAKNVRVMLADGQHTFVLAGLVSKTEAAYFVYNEVTDTILQVTSWKGDLNGFLDRFNGNVTQLPTKLLSS